MGLTEKKNGEIELNASMHLFLFLDHKCHVTSRLTLLLPCFSPIFKTVRHNEPFLPKLLLLDILLCR